MKLNHLLVTSSAAALLCAAASTAASAAPSQGASEFGGLEEIVVTARKREENLQNIPIAVSSLSGTQLAEQGIKVPTDLSRVVPSLDVQTETAATGAAAVMFEIRGQVASHSVLEVSQAVGMYQDGVNIPHPGGANLGFFDIERVDVLKGPQGTLYGRNTTGGAVNITTKGPDFKGTHGYVETEMGNYQDVRIAGAVNLPLVSDVFAVRLAGQRWSREGFGKSEVTGQRMGDDRNDLTSRISMLWVPAENFKANFQFEYDKADRHGRLEQPAFDAGGVGDFAAGLYSGATFAPGFCAPANLPFTCASIGAVAGAGAAAIAPYVNNTNRLVNYQNGLSDEHIRVWHTGLTLTWDINDNLQLKSVSGGHKVSIFKTYDLDGTPFQIVEVNLPGVIGLQPTFGTDPYPDQRYTALSQEFNLSGKSFNNRLNWLVGAYGSTEKGDSGTYHIAVTSFIDALNQAIGFPNAVASAGAQSQADVKSDTLAVFTQEDWHFTDKLFLTVGGRYTEERLSHKERAYNFYFGNGTFSCLDNEFVLVNGPDDCLKPQRKSYSSTSYLLSLSYQATPDLLLYAKTARGNRAGALQPFAPPALAAPAEPEVATDYEVGMKGEFFDRHLRMNLDVYRTNYKNLQAITIIANPANPNGAPFLPITNAGAARIQGFEGEISAVLLRQWDVHANVSYTDGKYTDYKNAVTPSNTIVDATGLEITNQDSSHPKWRYNVGTRYGVDAGPGTLFGQVDWSWHSHGILNASNLDSANPALQDAYIAKQKELRKAIGLMNARIDYELPDHELTLSVFCNNVFDKRYETVGLLGSALTGITTSIVQPPRMYGLVISKKFGE